MFFCFPVMASALPLVEVLATGVGILDGDIGDESWRLVLIIASRVVVLHGKLSRSRRRLLYHRLGLAVPLRFSGDGGGDGVVSGEDRRRIGLLQADFGVGVFGGASSGPSARSAPPGGVGLPLSVGKLAYQLAEKPGWDLSPTFHGGFVPLGVPLFQEPSRPPLPTSTPLYIPLASPFTSSSSVFEIVSARERQRKREEGAKQPCRRVG